jgi:hypothetical protein
LLVSVLAAFVMPATAGEVPSGASTVQSIDVEGTVFKVMLADGRVLYSPDLVGANLVIEQSNQLLRVRIDGIRRGRPVARRRLVQSFRAVAALTRRPFVVAASASPALH